MKSMIGYDNCIDGICTRFGQPPILIYDRSKIINKLESDGMNYQEAEEYFEYNIISGCLGDDTYGFIEPFDIEDAIQ